MKKFLGLKLPKRFKKATESDLATWFDSNKYKIFCAGDIEIYEDAIEWIHGNSTVRVDWAEVEKIYISSESGANNIYIISNDGAKINFYVNNQNSSRDKFLKNLQQFAALKGANLHS